MSEPTKATIKALEDYGYVQDNDVFKNETKGKCWTWIDEGHFLLLTRVGGDWYPVANFYARDEATGQSIYADSERSKDHTWYEFPDRWEWKFSEADVRKTYQDGMVARKAQAAFNAATPDETFAGLVPG